MTAAGDHADFGSFMRDAVLPHADRNPGARRLDGALTGGNREVFAVFRHHGRRWRVHSDTHFEPLRIAYTAVEMDPSLDPFEETPTAAGMCLVLVPDLRRRQTGRHKHLYIYAD